MIAETFDPLKGLREEKVEEIDINSSENQENELKSIENKEAASTLNFR